MFEIDKGMIEQLNYKVRTYDGLTALMVATSNRQSGVPGDDRAKDVYLDAMKKTKNALAADILRSVTTAYLYTRRELDAYNRYHSRHTV